MLNGLYLGGATQVFGAFSGGIAKVFADAEPHVGAVEHRYRAAAVKEPALQCTGEGGLAAAGTAGQEDRPVGREVADGVRVLAVGLAQLDGERLERRQVLSVEDLRLLELAVATRIYQHLATALPGIVEVACVPHVMGTVVQIRQQYEGKWWTLTGMQCMGCNAATKGDMSKRCVSNAPGYRGCNLVNARYDHQAKQVS